MSLPELLSWLVLLVALPLTWFVAVLLWRLSLDSPRLRVLRAHAVAALSLAIIVTIFAVVFLNNNFTPPLLDFPTTQIITRGSLLVISSASAIYWLRVIWRAQ